MCVPPDLCFVSSALILAGRASFERKLDFQLCRFSCYLKYWICKKIDWSRNKTWFNDEIAAAAATHNNVSTLFIPTSFLVTNIFALQKDSITCANLCRTHSESQKHIKTGIRQQKKTCLLSQMSHVRGCCETPLRIGIIDIGDSCEKTGKSSESVMHVYPQILRKTISSTLLNLKTFMHYSSSPNIAVETRVHIIAMN